METVTLFAVVTGATAAACGLFQDGVTEVNSAGSIHGKPIEIGFFKQEGLAGDYVLLRRVNERWHVESVSPASVDVPSGSELLFVMETERGALQVTPAFPDESPIDRPTRLFTCDSPLPGYGPCASTLVTNTLPPLRRAGVDRQTIAKAIDEGSVIEAIAEHRAAVQHGQDRAASYATFRANSVVRVAHVTNAPRLVTLSPEEAARLVAVSSEPAESGQTGSVRVTFRPNPRVYEVVQPYGKIRCWLTVDKPEYQFDFTGSSEAHQLDLVATVDHCNVVAPHPEPFVATDKTKTLTINVVSFNPEGVSTVSLSNGSSEFITVSSISLYYFGKIVTPEMGRVELPPHASTIAPVALRTVFSIAATFEGVTADNAAQKKFDFGVAAKFTRGTTGESTLLDQRQLSVQDLLAKVPAR